MKRRYLGLLALFLLNASPLYAAIIVNEVAWMGDQGSANHEWIELYNEGSSEVSVDGWGLGDGMNFNITLAGTVHPQSYAVLERSSEESSQAAAFLIYTGALVNTGATLVLKNHEGSIVDQVAGGENWQNIGGDNVTKETAQRTNSGWVTHAATPGAANFVGSAPLPSQTTESNTSAGTSKKSSGGGSSQATSPRGLTLDKLGAGLDVNLKAGKIAYVNQVVVFEGGLGLDDRSERLISYQWNFGDTYTASGRKVEHQYKYPGSYVVMLEARYKDSIEVARHEVTVLPVAVSLFVNEAGDIEVQNNAPYDVDVSGYTLKGIKSIVFPPHTILLPNSTITIASDRLMAAGDNLIVLYDTTKLLVTSTHKELGLATLESEQPYVSLQQIVETQNQMEVSPRIKEVNLATASPSSTAMAPTVPAVISAPNPATTSPVHSVDKTKWPYLAFIAILLLVLGGIFLTHTNKTQKAWGVSD